MNNQTSSLDFSHFPVMLNEVIKISSPSTKDKIIDCTFGGGNYSKEFLKFSKTDVIAIDRDKKVLAEAMDNNAISFYQNGTIIPNSDGSTPGNYSLDGLSNKTVFPTSSQYSYTFEWNFGGYTKFAISSAQSDENGYGVFEHAPPSGYLAICTKNLAENGG